MNKGFSIIEVILAIALFMIFSTGAVVLSLHNLDANRLGIDETIANQYAAEGMEAMRSIKNQSFSFILNTAGTGITRNGNGVWTYSGVNNTFGKFTRVIVVTDAQVDCTGNIVTNGTVDTNIKKVTSRVIWQSSPTRNNTITLTSYLTNWKQPIVQSTGGMLTYADTSGADDVIRYKILDNSGEWSSQQTIPAFSVPNNRITRVIKVYASSKRNEKMVITKHVDAGPGDDQYIYAHVWNGSTWSSQLVTSWTGTTRPEVRDFDGDYLSDGSFLFVYEDDTDTPRYQIWNGCSWSASGATLNVGGNPDWIVVRNRPGTNEAMVAVFDGGNDTNTMYWNGSTWVGLTEHATNSTGPTFENVGFEWSKNSPNSGALIFNEAGDNNPNIKIWNGSTWGSTIENISIGAETRAMQFISRPGADEFLGCFKDGVNDINCLESNHAPLWATLTNGEVTADTDVGNQRSFDIDYDVVSGNRALSVYSSGTTDAAKRIPKYRTFNPTTNAWSAESSLVALGGDGASSLEAVQIIPFSSSNDMMVVMAASDQDLWSVVWNGTLGEFYSSGGRSQTEHATSGTNDSDFWFDFAWDKY